MNKPTILITSPSVDTSVNVSGIANLTRLLLTNNSTVDYKHFIVGKKDSQNRNIYWFLSQFLFVINFIKFLFLNKKIHVNHINIPMSTLAIYVNFILIVISVLFNKKIIIHFRGGSLSLNENVNMFQKFIISSCIRMANKVIVLGKKEKKFMKKFYKIHENDKLFILPNAVDIPELEFQDNHILKKEDKLNIIFIGRLDKDKGLEEILHSLSQIINKVDFHFFVAGAGPDQDWFLDKCKKLICDNFTYLGVLNHNDKKTFYQSADIFLLPSYFEGLPNALLEAMASGVVPIVTSVGSISEVVFNGENGFIVPLKDHKSISERIKILDNDRHLLEKTKKSAYKSMLTDYSIQSYIIKLNRIYSSLN